MSLELAANARTRQDRGGPGQTLHPARDGGTAASRHSAAADDVAHLFRVAHRPSPAALPARALVRRYRRCGTRVAFFITFLRVSRRHPSVLFSTATNYSTSSRSTLPPPPHLTSSHLAFFRFPYDHWLISSLGLCRPLLTDPATIHAHRLLCSCSIFHLDPFIRVCIRRPPTLAIPIQVIPCAGTCSAQSTR